MLPAGIPLAEEVHEIDDLLRHLRGDAAAGGSNRHFRLAIVVIHVDRDQPVQQGVLALVYARVFLGIGGEDRAKGRVDFQVSVAAVALLGQVQAAARPSTLKSTLLASGRLRVNSS